MGSCDSLCFQRRDSRVSHFAVAMAQSKFDMGVMRQAMALLFFFVVLRFWFSGFLVSVFLVFCFFGFDFLVFWFLGFLIFLFLGHFGFAFPELHQPVSHAPACDTRGTFLMNGPKNKNQKSKTKTEILNQNKTENQKIKTKKPENQKIKNQKTKKTKNQNPQNQKIQK